MTEKDPKAIKRKLNKEAKQYKSEIFSDILGFSTSSSSTDYFENGYSIDDENFMQINRKKIKEK